MSGPSVLAIDPGTTRSAIVVLGEDGSITSAIHEDNPRILDLLRSTSVGAFPYAVALEMVASYGMAVGREVFETVFWAGRFAEALASNGHRCVAVYRADVKLHLCRSARAKDGNVRQALLDLYPRTGGGKVPQVGTKQRPGPLFGISGDLWAALGVAVTYRSAPDTFRPVGEWSAP